MLILGIETSCDETSVALVEDGRIVRANLIASQVQLHAQFGGVVPELASRAHIQKLIPMIDEALKSLSLTLDDPHAYAVTRGPGLVGALLIGVETAKALAFARGKPLIPVHHIAGHLYSPFLIGEGEQYRVRVVDGRNSSRANLTRNADTPALECVGFAEAPLRFPYIGLVVSGGHSSLVLVHEPTRFELLGQTVDDAAGEAFDKFAKLLELGYPGGPLIEKNAVGGDPARFALPRPMLGSGNLDFSFSGLKTAALKLVRELGLETAKADSRLLSDLCASFQEAVVDVLLQKARTAMEQTGIADLAIVGGVACNGRLRAAAAEYITTGRVVIPPPIVCTDNAAMIAGLAYHLRRVHTGCELTLNATAEIGLSAED